MLSHAEICKIQGTRNKTYGDRYETTHGRQPDFSAGVDNVTIVDVEQHEDKWSKVIARFEGKAGG